MKNETIRVFVITYKRAALLKRALNSLINQTYTNWVAEVINDDPLDTEVNELLRALADERIALKDHPTNFGATRNFNYCFSKKTDEPYASILEDDNWWEEDFLDKMVAAINGYLNAQMVVSNEKIWIEQNDGKWLDANRTVWDKKTGTELLEFNLRDKCGSAKICNSAMLWRTSCSNSWLTPNDLPVDVTEHFRERVIPHPILLVNKPLVNFSQTIATARSQNPSLWGSYQVLLVASAFRKIHGIERSKLAYDLFLKARKDGNSPYKTTLLHAALADKSARAIFYMATLPEILRYLLTWLKKPITSYTTINAVHNNKEHFHYLININPNKGC
ncbi:glycosyltransferase [Pedobacter sp. 22163]|uniref:glycosyltransferase n=1 Tax=Pedobacter sp. 22163 TaxID=3453883 RepID=UPI003F841182